MTETLNGEMKQPHFPIIAISPVLSVRVFYNINEFSNIKLSDWIYQTPFQFAFDSRGNKWHYQYGEPGIKNNFWNEFLNPSIKVGVNWVSEKTNAVEDLKSDLTNLIDKEDDVMTRYENEKFLKAAIRGCDTVSDILNVLDKYVFNENEEEVWRAGEFEIG